jgi:mRNA-degrading endonuclease toxin of MazEF toxin-antitoxin module
MDSGDLYIADLGAEQPRRVLVLSNRDFHRRSERAIVAPETRAPDTAAPFPWIVEGDDGMSFAIDRVRAVSAERLLRPAGRAPYRTTWLARRALLAITVDV